MMTEIPDTSPDRRQEERRPVELRAFARPAGGDVAEARISDLSYDGCGMACTPAPQRGERLVLRVFGLGIVEAEVRWSRDGRAGCRFLS